MPDLVRLLGYFDPGLLVITIGSSEQAQFNSAGVFRKKRKIHALSIPRCAKRIRFSRSVFMALVGRIRPAMHSLQS